MAARKPARKLKSSSIDRRDRIVQAALELYVEQGVAQTRSNEIARRAKVDPPLVLYYFRDPDSLSLAVIGKVLESLKDYSLRESSKHDGDSERQMREYVRAPLAWASENPKLMTLWLYFYHLASRPGPFRTLNDSIRSVGRERIAQMIYRGVERGVFRVDAGWTVSELAIEIQSILSGFAVVFASEGGVGARQAMELNERRILAILRQNSISR